MKVLMFGWEFPPHISGGLGTACAGLTQALQNARIGILFVVPKLHGDERAGGTTFLSASAYPIRQKKMITISPAVTPKASEHRSGIDSPRSSISPAYSRETAFATASHTVIAVPSLLSPYQSGRALTSSIEHWNYSFESGAVRAETFAERRSQTDNIPHAAVQTRYIKKAYSFSGTYGCNLFEEVDRYAQAAAEIAKRHSFDVIHAHDWMTYRAGIAAKRISGKPLVVHVHATEVDRSGEQVNPAIFEIERQGMTVADKVITVSQWTKNITIRHYGITADKVEVIHNGIARRDSEAMASSVFPPLGSPVVTFLGRITHQKGPMYFVDAARKVHEALPDAHFVVAGSGDQLPAMVERIAQLRLSSRFHFTGFVRGEDINRVWAMSTVYVMPSVSEPFGIAPLEAIQAGVPVVLSKQAGVSEVMPHAIKVDFWNTEALSEAICNVLRYKSLANTLKTNGSEEIKNITWDKAAQKLKTIYYDLTKQQHGMQEESDPILSSSPAQAPSRPEILRHRQQQ